MLAKIHMNEEFSKLLEAIYGEMQKENRNWYAGSRERILAPGFACLVAPEMATRMQWKVRPGLQSSAKGFGWLRSSGSFVWVVEDDPTNDYGNPSLILGGRRHSLKELISMFFPAGWEGHVTRYEYVDTQREDITPWETTT